MLMIHDNPRKINTGTQAHWGTQNCHSQSQVLPGYWYEAVELDDAQNVDEERDAKEETPGEHAEGPERVELADIGRVVA